MNMAHGGMNEAVNDTIDKMGEFNLVEIKKEDLKELAPELSKLKWNALNAGQFNPAGKSEHEIRQMAEIFQPQEHGKMYALKGPEGIRGLVVLRKESGNPTATIEQIYVAESSDQSSRREIKALFVQLKEHLQKNEGPCHRAILALEGDEEARAAVKEAATASALKGFFVIAANENEKSDADLKKHTETT